VQKQDKYFGHFRFLVSNFEILTLVLPGRYDVLVNHGRPRFDSGKGEGFFSSPPIPDRLWSPTILLSSGYWWLFRRGWSDRGVKLTTYYTVAELEMRGAIPPFHHVFMAWYLIK